MTSQENSADIHTIPVGKYVNQEDVKDEEHYRKNDRNENENRAVLYVHGYDVHVLLLYAEYFL